MVTQALAADALNVMRCGLADEAYGLDMTSVRGIERVEKVRFEPEPDGALGRLRTPEGEVPVYALARLLPNAPRAAPGHKVIVLRGKTSAWGLLAGRVAQARRVPTSAVFPLPAGTADPFTTPWSGVIRQDDDLVLLLAPERLRPGGDDEGDAPAWLPSSAGAEGFGLALSSGRGRLVLFAVAEAPPDRRPLVFGLSITQVVEVVEVPKLTSVPGSPPHVAGLAWWRGRPLAVVDLARRMGLPPARRDGRSRLLVVRTSTASDVAGFLVCPTVRVLPLPLPHLPTTRPQPVDPTLMLTSVELKGETVVFPDLAAVLA